VPKEKVDAQVHELQFRIQQLKEELANPRLSTVLRKKLFAGGNTALPYRPQ
jgi:hypothetical protein